MNNTYAIGFDIGGTKCAVILGRIVDGDILVVSKRRFATSEAASPEDCLERMCREAGELTAAAGIGMEAVSGVGISCGGPLDSAAGVIQSPPNLPGWDNIPAASIVGGRLGLPARLENDANACALAEWKFGAGRGSRDMIFLTFGTGLGAGIISGGRLVSGHSGMAGECGHVRLAPDGPTGYGKAGSFEGFCSGGGIKRLAERMMAEAKAAGRESALFNEPHLSARTVALAAKAGDALAKEVYNESARRLGQALAILIDLLNPEAIVIGSIYTRDTALFKEIAEDVIRNEALPLSAGACRILPAQLTERIGDIAALGLIAGTEV